MSARSGLQICAALDALGATVPWHEYMTTFRREQGADATDYGEMSDRAVHIAWLRGRLRLQATDHETAHGFGGGAATHSSNEDYRADLRAPLRWDRLAQELDDGVLPTADVVEALLDTSELSGIMRLLEELDRPAAVCLALAEAIAAGRASASRGDALYWAKRAAAFGVPPGCALQLIALGVDSSDIALGPAHDAHDRLQKLTRQVQERPIQSHPEHVGEWIDACALALRTDVLGLNSAEAMLRGPGWYTCWLRFTIALLYAEDEPAGRRSRAGVDALRILTEVRDPFLGNRGHAISTG